LVKEGCNNATRKKKVISDSFTNNDEICLLGHQEKRMIKKIEAGYEIT